MRLGSTLICRFVRSTSSRNRPWQLALAVTAGVLLGILPKSSMLIVVVGLICFAIPSHLVLLALTAILVSFAAPLLESTLGSIGLWSLSHPQMSAFWMHLDSLPFVPWLGLHNTVVNGSLIAWLVLSLPIYCSSLVISRKLIAEALPDEVADIMLSAEANPNSIAVDSSVEISPITGSREPVSGQPRIEPPVVIWDALSRNRRKEPIATRQRADADANSESNIHSDSETSDQVIRRTADLAVWAEELITEELLMDDRAGWDNSDTLKSVDNSLPQMGADEQERWLIETTIEMVRIAERAVTNQAAINSKQAGPSQKNAGPVPSTQENAEIQTGNSTHDAKMNFQTTSSALGTQSVAPHEATIRREQMPHMASPSHLENSRKEIPESPFAGAVNRPREEALHYLLRHLKGVQEKAQKQ